MSPRSPWQGMLTVARLNWPFYLTALVAFVVASVVLVFAPGPGISIVCILALAGCIWFLVGSLAVSHLVYDRSDLYRWQWLGRALPDGKGRSFVFCHTGFDEASASLRELLAPEKWTVLDHFDGARMTEPSIRRARRLFPPTDDTIAAPFDRWPIDSATADVVFGLLAIHELRSEAERIAWFAEARRVLHAGGRVVLVEHVRDFANFVAFGPGFLHFHSRASWRRCGQSAGLRLLDEFRLTAWVRVFVLEAP